MKSIVRTAIPALFTAVLLAACGGGGDDQGPVTDQREPTSSGMSASMALSGATAADAVFNGPYTTTDIWLNEVIKVNPVGGDPETCRFRFTRLVQTGSTRTMSGEIRYIPANPRLNVAFVSVDTVEFRIDGETPTVTVDRANNRIVFTAAHLISTQNTGRSIDLTGAIPMRQSRPEGC